MQFIQSIYKKNSQGNVIVNVSKGRKDAVEGEMRKLENFVEYQAILEIVESAPSEFLMQGNLPSNTERSTRRNNDPQYNVLAGTGSLIAIVDDGQLRQILSSRHLRNLQDVITPNIPYGTLTCFAKYHGKFYAITAQHVLDTHRFSGEKNVLAQIHFDCVELLLADIVLLSSRYHGCLKVVNIGSSDNVVDIALLPLLQRELDEASLKLVKVFKRDDSHGIDGRQNSEDFLQDQLVTKVGAITGKTHGTIEHASMYCTSNPTQHNSASGEMFAIKGVTEQPFAAKGDSGSLVTIKLDEEVYALGIISQIQHGLALCVRMEDCLKALESIRTLDEPIISSDMEIYTGSLRPLVCVQDRRMPHVQLVNA